MPDIALCGNYENCTHIGRCIRHPDSYKAIGEHQSWAYFKGTEECPNKAVDAALEGREGQG